MLKIGGYANGRKREKHKEISIHSDPFTSTFLGTIGVSYAITNGQPDGNGHPYVGAVHNGVVFCSGAAISPNIFVTAAHCFNYSGEEVWVTFDPEPFAPGNNPKYYTGTWYPHPDFCLGCGPGLPGNDTNDVAVVVLDEPFFPEKYAQLPTEGLVATLAMGTAVTVVGYGAQFYVPGGGPRQPVYLRTRYYAASRLITSHHKQLMRLYSLIKFLDNKKNKC